MYLTQAEFESKVIDRLNALHPNKGYYKFRTGDKYAIVKCNGCNNFQLWFTFDSAADGNKINFRFFRVINLNHLHSKHPNRM